MDAVVFVALWLGAFAVWMTAVVDGVRTPAAAWRRTGRPKGPWIVALVLLGCVSGVYYWAVVRRQLRTAGH